MFYSDVHLWTCWVLLAVVAVHISEALYHADSAANGSDLARCLCFPMLCLLPAAQAVIGLIKDRLEPLCFFRSSGAVDDPRLDVPDRSLPRF